MEDKVVSIEELFQAVKKRWKLVILCTIVATLLSGIISFFIIKPRYEANTKIFIGKEEGENQNYDQSDVAMYQKLMKTYSEAIKTKDLIGRALKNSSLNLKEDTILQNLIVLPVADTQILQIKFKGKDKEETRDVIEAITKEFINTSKDLVPNGNTKVIEKVELPEKPISPNKKMNIIIAFALGFLVGIGLCFLLEFLDNTFKNKEQLEKELGVPVIGVIPNIDRK